MGKKIGFVVSIWYFFCKIYAGFLISHYDDNYLLLLLDGDIYKFDKSQFGQNTPLPVPFKVGFNDQQFKNSVWKLQKEGSQKRFLAVGSVFSLNEESITYIPAVEKKWFGRDRIVLLKISEIDFNKEENEVSYDLYDIAAGHNTQVNKICILPPVQSSTEGEQLLYILTSSEYPSLLFTPACIKNNDPKWTSLSPEEKKMIVQKPYKNYFVLDALGSSLFYGYRKHNIFSLFSNAEHLRTTAKTVNNVATINSLAAPHIVKNTFTRPKVYFIFDDKMSSISSDQRGVLQSFVDKQLFNSYEISGHEPLADTDFLLVLFDKELHNVLTVIENIGRYEYKGEDKDEELDLNKLKELLPNQLLESFVTFVKLTSTDFKDILKKSGATSLDDYDIDVEDMCFSQNQNQDLARLYILFRDRHKDQFLGGIPLSMLKSNSKKVAKGSVVGNPPISFFIDFWEDFLISTGLGVKNNDGSVELKQYYNPIIQTRGTGSPSFSGQTFVLGDGIVDIHVYSQQKKQSKKIIENPKDEEEY